MLGPGGAAELGELVADVIVAPDEAAWLGVHRHDATRPAYPGGALPVEVPADAPSRAYAKIEEAIAWAKLPVEAGQIALEIGAAPGGAALALARRGLKVWGVDTGELAPNVLAHPNVVHVAKKVGALRWEELPERVDWLLVDVNLAPQVALHEVARLMPRLRTTLRGAVFTLKLNDWALRRRAARARRADPADGPAAGAAAAPAVESPRGVRRGDYRAKLMIALGRCGRRVALGVRALELLDACSAVRAEVADRSG